MNSSRTLIIIKDLKQLKLIANYFELSNCVLVTDCPKIHKLYKNNNHKKIKIYFKNRSISFSEILTKEKKLFDKINAIFEYSIKKIPTYISKLDKHVEDNKISGQVRGILLFIYNLEKIIIEERISDIAVCENYLSYRDLKIMDFLALENNLSIRRFNLKPRLNFGSFLKGFKKYFKKHIYVYYVILKTIISYKERTSFKKFFNKNKNSILISSFAFTKHHLNNRLGLCKEFEKLNQPSSILGLSIKSNLKMYKKENVNYFSLITISNFSDILSSFFLWLINSRYIYKNLLKGSKNLSHFESFLIKALLPDIKYFLDTELFTRILLWKSSKRFNKNFSIGGYRLINNFEAFLGNIFYRELMEKENKKPIFFRNDTGFKWGAEQGDEYRKFYQIQFTAGENDLRMYKKKVHKSCKLIVAGTKLSETFYVNKKENTKLGFKKNDILKKILFATGGCIPGTYSTEELFNTLNVLLEFAFLNKDIEIIIKPHPGEDSNSLKSMIGKNVPNNFILFSKDSKISELIDSSDLLLAKTSNVIIEAISKSKPVISICCDEDSYFYEIMNQRLFTVRSFDDLTSQLDKLKNNKIFARWAENERIKNFKFLEAQLSSKNTNSNKFIAENVIKFMKAC